MPFWQINVQSLYLLVFFNQTRSVFLRCNDPTLGRNSCVLIREDPMTTLCSHLIYRISVSASNTLGLCHVFSAHFCPSYVFFFTTSTACISLGQSYKDFNHLGPVYIGGRGLCFMWKREHTLQFNVEASAAAFYVMLSIKRTALQKKKKKLSLHVGLFFQLSLTFPFISLDSFCRTFPGRD